MKTYTVRGRKVRACGASCAEGFREDRKQGLIYSAYKDTDTGEVFNPEEASVHFDHCVYCGVDNEDN